MERPVAPLRQAEDALLVDTTRISAEQAAASIVETVRAIAALMPG
jgi:cytidylate kinase